MQITRINPHYHIQYPSFKSRFRPASIHSNNDETMRFLSSVASLNVSQVERSNIEYLLNNDNIKALLDMGILDLSDIKDISKFDENSFKHTLKIIENKNFVDFLKEKEKQQSSLRKFYINQDAVSNRYSMKTIETVLQLDDNSLEKFLELFDNQTICDGFKKNNFHIVLLVNFMKENLIPSNDLPRNLEELFLNDIFAKAGKNIIYYSEEDYLSFANQDRNSFQKELKIIEGILKKDVIKNTCARLGKIGFRQIQALSEKEDEDIEATLNNIRYLSNKTIEANEKYDFEESLINADGILGLVLSNPKAIGRYKKLLENEGFLKSKEKLGLFINDVESLINLNESDFDKYDRLMRNKTVQYAIDEGLFDKDSFSVLLKLSDESIENIDLLIHEIIEQKKTVLKHPELYLNGVIEDPEVARDEIDYFFLLNSANMAVFLEYSDKETLNHILRQRFDNAQSDLIIFLSFSKTTQELYSKLTQCVGGDDKPLAPSQKLQLITLLQAYEDLRVNFGQVSEMAQSGVVDMGKLNYSLTKNIMSKMGIDEDEIALYQDSLSKWDISNLHYLSQYTRKDSFRDIIKASLCDFKNYIQGDNKYGRINANTKKEFEDNGLNYEKWLNPSSDLEVTLITENENDEQLNEIRTKIEKSMQTFLNSGVKEVINKRFPYCIKNGRFKIPSEINNKEKLKRFIKNIIEQLNDVWARAEENQRNPIKAMSANRTLLVLLNLKGSLYDIDNIKNEKKTKPLDVKVKMWDRIPQKDLFQGNHSTCCIAMGATNADNMPHYLLNTAYNMIEIVDNTNNKPIGNALCYFVKGEDNKPKFVIDNIEINNAVKTVDETGIYLRDAIIKYASNVAYQVTGKKDTPIYIGGARYNDVPVGDLISKARHVRFIGDIDCDEIYMDLYSGLTRKDRLKEEDPVFVYIA